MTVGRVGNGRAVAAFATYNPVGGQGCIKLKVLNEEIPVKKRPGFWESWPKLARPLSIHRDPTFNFYPDGTAVKTSSPNDQGRTEDFIGRNIVTTAKKPASATRCDQMHKVDALGLNMVTPKTCDTPFGPNTKAAPDSSCLARRLAVTTPFTKPARISIGNSSSIAAAGSPDSITPVFRNVEQMVKESDHEDVREKEAAGKARPMVSKKKRKVEAAVDINPNEGRQSLESRQGKATKYVKASDSPKKNAVLSTSVPNKRKVAKVKPRLDPEPEVGKSSNTSENKDAAQPQKLAPPGPRKRLNLNGPGSFNDSETSSQHDDVEFKSPMKDAPLSPRPTRSPAVVARSPAVPRKDQALIRKLILQSCESKLDEIQGLLDALPRTSIWKRKTMMADSMPQENLLVRQEVARSQLASEHRAAHEFLRKQILHATRNTVLSVQKAPRVSTIERAKTLLRDTLDDYEQRMEAMIHQQEMEASTLEALQTRERNGEKAPLLQVSFAFPSIFEQAMGCLPQLTN